MTRSTFARDHPGVFLVDPADAAALERYLVERGVLEAGERPVHVSKAGDGNMNCTVRVVTPRRRLIVKQGRPWVEKYDHIPAPWNRTLVEAAFYQAVGRDPEVARRMPDLVHVDAALRVLVLEDIDGPDLTALYRGAELDQTSVSALVAYLIALHRLPAGGDESAVFANREMRTLNHQHIFDFPLVVSNGLHLDAVTAGLQTIADQLKGDTAFVRRVTELGVRYLADGDRLVHGDFFPGSWLQSSRGPVVIDPEFCFRGAGEFDFGVMIGHLILAEQRSATIEAVRDAMPSTYDTPMAMQFAGVEIMRRLIGVAQLPLNAAPLEQKRAWLDRARALVLTC